MNYFRKFPQDGDGAIAEAGPTVLCVDASGRYDGSVSRRLTAALTDRIAANFSGSDLIVRDLAQGIPQIAGDWIGANLTPAADRNSRQRSALALSDELVGEIKRADIIVLGVPLYNFNVPAALKAYIDQIARAGVTFQYSENGPKGLLEGKRAIVIVATGGVPVGSPVDFATPYLRHVLGFIGISDVEIIAADQLVSNADSSVTAAIEAINTVRLETHA